LYESLVDPDERHDLGEYYTPDWLAGRVVAQSMDAPLTQRVLDPACGSGTFLFQALRRLIDAGRDAGWTELRIVECCAEQVRGLDVHPVAVTLARVTWLLAMGKLLRAGPSRLTVPVFLGDAMQWNLRRFVDRTDVAIDVPGEDRPLRIPLGFAEQQAAFENGRDELNRGLAEEGRCPLVDRRARKLSDGFRRTPSHRRNIRFPRRWSESGLTAPHPNQPPVQAMAIGQSPQGKAPAGWPNNMSSQAAKLRKFSRRPRPEPRGAVNTQPHLHADKCG
jgi:SAM-dependent methyltransferase